MGQPAGLHKIGLPPSGANTNDIIAKQVYTRLFWFVDRSCACNYDSGPCKSTQLFILYINRAFNRLGFWVLMLRTPIYFIVCILTALVLIGCSGENVLWRTLFTVEPKSSNCSVFLFISDCKRPLYFFSIVNISSAYSMHTVWAQNKRLCRVMDLPT